MPERVKLSDDAIAKSLAEIPGWSVRDGALFRELRFRDFVEAWGFLSRAALIAERMNHHPDWTNVYSTVRIRLSTHDAGGITATDFELARRLNALA